MTGAPDEPHNDQPLVVAIEMGYGHMRAGSALAEELGVALQVCDKPPLADAADTKRWHKWRRLYEWLTRTSTLRIGAPLRPLVAGMTRIEPLAGPGELTACPWGVRRLSRFLRKRGLGSRLVETLRETGRPMLSTYFAPALAADLAGLEANYLVVTDSDVHRIWAPQEAATTRIAYCVPSDRTRERLMAYGVPAERIDVTGFPLPGALLGGPTLPTLRANLARRLVRLDPAGRFRAEQLAGLEAALGPLPESEQGRAPTVVFAVGGAGTQAELAPAILDALGSLLQADRLRLVLVAGIRTEVRQRFEQALTRSGVSRNVEILFREALADYFQAFNALLANTDLLWTKPSELSFFAALGLPLLLATPVGMHEGHNRTLLLEHGAAVDLPDPTEAATRLPALLADGTLARAAWSGFRELPARGLYRVLERVRRGP